MNSAAMEQRSKYMHWGMWGARSSSSTASPIPWAAAASYGGEPSWEEQAFARDAAANLGGCVWPPRSYSCSFCQREFRSAQALGGHMNVHRRDRARLRQCSSPDDVQLEAPHDYQPHQDTFLYRAVSNPSTTTPSVPVAKGDVTISCSTTPSPSYLSTIIKESKNKVLMPMAVREEALDQYDEEEESGRATKRRRVDQPPVTLPIFVRPATEAPLVVPCQGVVDHDAKVHKTTASPSSSSPLVDPQEVDLELRLGTTPKVT